MYNVHVHMSTAALFMEMCTNSSRMDLVKQLISYQINFLYQDQGP